MSRNSAKKKAGGFGRRDFLKSAPLLAYLPHAMVQGSNGTQKSGSPRKGQPEKPVTAKKLLETVPEPLLPTRPDLVEMYRKCWEIGLQKSEFGTPENGFVHWYIDAAFDRRIFQWDTCFSVAWAKYSQGGLPGIVSLDNFYRKQHPDGAISGVIRKKDGTDDQPLDSPWYTRNNLFSWIEYEYYQVTGDASRFPRVLPVLKKYANWVRKNRRHSNGHYFWSGWSSGMDNSPRSRADKFYPPYSWVDYDANEALSAWFIAKIASVTGDKDTEAEFLQLHRELKKLVNTEMWSEEDRFYWDLDKDGSFLKVKTVASFWPMWGRITGQAHLEGLVHHLNDAGSFNRPHRVPTTAADEPKYAPEGKYWLGSVWAPTNHMIVKGLEANDRHQLARDIVQNHLNNLAIIFRDTGTVWENYSPEFTKPGKPWAKQDFVGWSAVGPIAQLIEHYIGLKIDVPQNRIRWDLLSTEELGLRNLKFGSGKMRLLAKSRKRLSDPIRMEIDAPQEFLLVLNDGNKIQERKIPAGKQEVTFSQV